MDLSSLCFVVLPCLALVGCGDDAVSASEESTTTETGAGDGDGDGDPGDGDGDPGDGDGDPGDGDGDPGDGDGDPGDGDGDQPATPLQAGVAMRYLEYPVGISLAGFGGRVGGTNTAWSGLFYGTRGFYGYPTIKAMVMESEEGEQVVLMKTPMMSAESGVTDATAAKYEELYGEDLRGRILWGATHSHHAHGRYWRLPDIFGAVGTDTADEEVIDLLATEFAMTIKAAMDDLGDAEWGYTAIEDWDPMDKVYGDRRGGNNPIYGKDPTLTVFGLRRPDGTPMAAMFNFGMHGISVAYENELLTEDAPGAVELEFEQYFFEQTGEPIFGMIAQAGGGDSSPRGGFLNHGPATQRTELIGMVAAPVIFDAYQNLEWDDDPEIVVQSQRVDLTYDKFGYDENGEFSGTVLNVIPIDYTWGGWQCTGVAEDDDLETSMEGKDKQCIPVDTLLFGDVPHGEIHQTYLSVAKIGPLFMMTIPGEPAYSIIKYARDQFATLRSSDPIDLMVWGYSQDHLLYFTAPDDWYQGGYEAEMSLWGPFGGTFMVDTNLAMIEDILAGQVGPALVEETPSLAEPGGFSARAYELSQNHGAVVTNVETMQQRLDLVRFGFGGGDPSVGAPNVRVQVDDGQGNFVDVPHPAGWAGRAYDNSRNEMITHYEPTPAPNGEVAASRAHEWYVDWEIPADWPAGEYRMIASGPYWDGANIQTYEAISTVFMVEQSDAAALVANLADPATLYLTLVLPTVDEVKDGTWPIRGWRLHDAWHTPDQGIHVRAPISLEFIVDGMATGEVWEASYDPVEDAYVFDFAQTGLDPDANLEVDAWLSADLEPSIVTTAITGP
ncbi:Neutral/alkaline non-lysosomal ceramidase [Enhygromyxa salina]|uniref:Neutral/alkaline non-lysosomal ceramidase n=2 Tax=Enhygromyxa salina TaxID=215803 RepID=A0A2S9XCY2_9BACT|nr:Neutral/alkaline non-lysosomal ceramidase [Enhygromyxa salina]